jgi:hypothetical protein
MATSSFNRYGEYSHYATRQYGQEALAQEKTVRPKVGMIAGIGDCLYLDDVPKSPTRVYHHNYRSTVNFNYTRDLSQSYKRNRSNQYHHEYTPTKRCLNDIISPPPETERCEVPEEPNQGHHVTRSVSHANSLTSEIYPETDKQSEGLRFLWGECFQRFSKVSAILQQLLETLFFSSHLLKCNHNIHSFHFETRLHQGREGQERTMNREEFLKAALFISLTKDPSTIYEAFAQHADLGGGLMTARGFLSACIFLSNFQEIL